MDFILKVQDLTKKFKNNRGIEKINLSLKEGDIYGLLGPNGAGKTTIMKCITGLCRSDKGNIFIHQLNMKENFEEAISKVGCMVGSVKVYEYMNAYQHLQMAARFYPEIPKSRIDEVLELVELIPYKYEKAGSYSTGMRQRLGLALAIFSKPSLLLLDEPTNGLDIDGKRLFHDIILRMVEENKLTILLSSHLIEDMNRVCTRFGIIQNGQLVAEENSDFTKKIYSLENFYIKNTRVGE